MYNCLVNETFQNQGYAMEKPEAQISIIVPVYNCEGDVMRCLESLMAQTYKHWEAICVDDGSTDASPALLDELAARDSRFRVIHQANGGVSRARNVGLDCVRTPYITMLDADDVLEQDALEKMYTCMQENPCDMVLIGIKRVLKDKVILSGCGRLSAGKLLAHPSQFFLDVPPGPVAKLYRNDIIRQHQIRFPSGMKIGEDFMFNARYWCYTRTIHVLNECLYLYMESETSVVDKFMSGRLPYETYEQTVRLPHSVYKMTTSFKDGVHQPHDWVCVMLAAQLVEQSWVIGDCLLAESDKKKLRSIARKCYADMAAHVPFTKRFCIKRDFYIRWIRGRVMRLLGKVKRALKRTLGMR